MQTFMRICRPLLLGLAFLLLTMPAAAQEASPSAETPLPNLLQNGDLGGEFAPQGSLKAVPQGWHFFIISGTPNSDRHTWPPDALSPPFSWKFQGQGSRWRAGAFQQADVEAGTDYTFRAHSFLWACDDALSGCLNAAGERVADQSAAGRVRIGIDPTGRRDLSSTELLWSEWFSPYDDYAELRVTATAQQNRVTVYILAESGMAMAYNEAYWDDLQLLPSAELPPPAPATASATDAPTMTATPTTAPSTPTETPSPTQTLAPTMTSSPSASPEAIAERTAEAFAETPAEAIAEATAETTAEAPTEAPTEAPGETPQESPTEVAVLPPTPEATPEAAVDAAETLPSEALPERTEAVVASTDGAGGTICIQVFDDVNQNGLFDEGDALLPDAGVRVGGVVLFSAQIPLCFQDVAAGEQVVQVVELPADYALTSSGQYLVTLAPGERVDLSIGAAQGVELALALTPPQETLRAPVPELLRPVEPRPAVAADDVPFMERLFDYSGYIVLSLAVAVLLLGVGGLLLWRPWR